MKNKTSVQSEQLYAAINRWHFYAGIFVLPFLFMLSVSGLLMLITKPIEPLFHQALIEVQPQAHSLSASELLSTVEKQYAHGKVKLYIPPTMPNEAARFSVVAATDAGHGGHSQSSLSIYVNPFSGEILGSLDPAQSLYTFVKDFHGSFFLGDFGDGLIEITSGLAVLMVLTGLFMAWPHARWRSLKSEIELTGREAWRRLHRVVGLFVGVPLILFLLSGLAWTNFWGNKMVQPWGSLPGTSFTAPNQQPQNAQAAQHNHQSMNLHGEHRVPWAMEQTPMPISTKKLGGELNLGSVVDIAKQLGFDNFRVHLPQTDSAVWTVSATTIARDITNPLAERTIHLDRFSGEILADIQLADYPKLGQAMATFIPLHQGDLGLWNWLLNLVLILMIIFMMYAGILMWWKRRPKNQSRLAPPIAKPSVNKVVVGLMLVIALCFPLSALALASMLVIDWLVVSRITSLRKVLK